MGRRRQAEGDVLHHFDEDSPQAKGYELAKAGVSGDTNDDLLGGWQHLLHLYAQEARIGVVGPGISENSAITLLHRSRAGQTCEYTASVRLVQNVGRDNF